MNILLLVKKLLDILVINGIQCQFMKIVVWNLSAGIIMKVFFKNLALKLKNFALS